MASEIILTVSERRNRQKLTLSSTAAPFVFGRGRDCSFVLRRNNVGEHQFTIEYKNNAWLMQDAGSTTCGTWYNNRYIHSGEEVTLQPGDVIGLNIDGNETTQEITFRVEEIRQGEGTAALRRETPNATVLRELDVRRKLIYVHPVEGKMEISWPGDYGEIHTRILEHMKRVLEEDTVYPYLKPNAAKRLAVARRLAKSTGMLRRSIVHLGGYSWCIFPWLGTRSFRTLRRYIAANAHDFRISGIEYEGCYYITFKMEGANDYDLARGLAKKVAAEGIDCSALVGEGECPVFEKYDDHVPPSLLRRAYAADKLTPHEAEKRIEEIFREYSDEAL